MWREAIRLLIAKHPLVVVEAARRVRLHGHSNHYVLTIQVQHQEASSTTFEQPQLALLSFLDQIGEMALVRAVGAARYGFLFPTGSSMDWPQKPLHTWRPPAHWVKRPPRRRVERYYPASSSAMAIAAGM